MPVRLCLLFLLTALPAAAAELTRAEVLQALAPPSTSTGPAIETTPPAGPAEATPTRSGIPPEAEAPAADTPYIEAAERMASAQPDSEMTAALLGYMFYHRSPASTVPARALGVVFVEQPETFVTTYKAQPKVLQALVWPYLEFGYGRALQGKNRSIMKYKRAQKRFDALAGSMMNLGR